MVNWKKISDKIQETKVIIGFSIFFGLVGLYLSGNLIVGILTSILSIIIMVIWDLDQRMKKLEGFINKKRKENIGGGKMKKGVVNYEIIIIILIILLILLILSGKLTIPFR